MSKKCMYMYNILCREAKKRVDWRIGCEIKDCLDGDLYTMTKEGDRLFSLWKSDPQILYITTNRYDL